MKLISILLLSLLSFAAVQWHNNLEEAKQIAKTEHKHILLNFSGSDWCGPCIRMHKEIFENEIFKQMADTDLVLVNADFPRMKKNQLPKEQQKLNDEMADRYNPAGKFPYTVLLNADGKVLKEWEGFPETTPETFITEIRNGINADR